MRRCRAVIAAAACSKRLRASTTSSGPGVAGRYGQGSSSRSIVLRPRAARRHASRSATVTSQPNNVGERSGWRRMKMSHLIEIAPSNTARVRRRGDG